jgi:Putative transposase
VTDNTVTFRTKDGKRTTLHPVEFLRRFAQHVLPDRFHEIRHLGLYAGSAVAETLPAARAALATSAPTSNAARPPSWREQLRSLTGHDVDRCRVCSGPVDHVPLSAALTTLRPRAPPPSAAA